VNPCAIEPVFAVDVPAADERVIPDPRLVVIVLSVITIPEFVPETLIAFDNVLFEIFTLVGGVADAPLTLIPCPTVVSVAVLPEAANVLG